VKTPSQIQPCPAVSRSSPNREFMLAKSGIESDEPGMKEKDPSPSLSTAQHQERTRSRTVLRHFGIR
jgi:hypothetical protein